MARKMKNYNISKHVSSEILQGTKTHGNYVSYDIKASNITDAQIKRMAKLANDRLYKLEKSGMSEYSREYQLVEHYAVGDPAGKGSIYNVNEEKGRIRFTSSTRGMTQEERSYYINTMRNFLNAETSTISGTRKAIDTAFQTFKENHGSKLPDLTVDQYQNLWKTYRESVLPDRMSHEAYNAYLHLIENTNLYELSQDQLDMAVKYIADSTENTTVGIVGQVMDNLPFIRN